MRRRNIIAGALSAVAMPRAFAQTNADSPRLVIFSLSEPTAFIHEDANRYYGTLFNELRRLGRVEGQNLKIERYGKDQNTSGPAALAAEAVASVLKDASVSRYDVYEAQPARRRASNSSARPG